MNKNSSKKRTFVVVVIVLLVIIALVVINQKSKLLGPESREFTGILSEIRNDSVIVEGKFIYSGSEDVKELIKVEILINPETKITKTELVLPEASELEKTGGRYYVDDLEQETSVVDFATLYDDAQSNPIGITVLTDKNVFGQTRFIAKEINYRFPKRQ